MKKIIEDVLSAEEDVNSILKQAREKASQIRYKSEKEISARISQARIEARDIVQKIVEDANQEAQDYRESHLSQTDQSGEVLFKGKEDIIDRLVDGISELIMSSEYGKDNQ